VTGNVAKDLEQILQRTDVRTADRANVRRMLVDVKRGQSLTYQDRQNLWAYIDRYLIHPAKQTEIPQS